MVYSTFHLSLHRPRGFVIVPPISISRKQRELGGQGSGDYVQVGSLRDCLVLVEHQFSRVASHVQACHSRHAGGRRRAFSPRWRFPTRNRSVLATVCGDMRFTDLNLHK